MSVQRQAFSQLRRAFREPGQPRTIVATAITYPVDTKEGDRCRAASRADLLLDTWAVERLEPVLLLSGPSGSGKSTTAQTWADTQPVTTAWIDCDAVRGFIRAGYSRPDIAFDDEAERQWMLAARISAHMAHAYVEENIRCVVDVYAPPIQKADIWDRLLAGLAVVRVHLFPGFDTCRERNAQRAGKARLTDEALEGNYSGYAWCVERASHARVIDNTGLTIEDTVVAVERVLSTYRAAHP
jgi:adenylylsulfate kinase-like enzyme